MFRHIKNFLIKVFHLHGNYCPVCDKQITYFPDMYTPLTPNNILHHDGCTAKCGNKYEFTWGSLNNDQTTCSCYHYETGKYGGNVSL